MYCVSCKKNNADNNSSAWRSKQKGLMFCNQIMLFVVRKNQGSLKIKKQVYYWAN